MREDLVYQSGAKISNHDNLGVLHLCKKSDNFGKRNEDDEG